MRLQTEERQKANEDGLKQGEKEIVSPRNSITEKMELKRRLSSFPPNYVTLQQLKELRLKEQQQQKQLQEEEEEKLRKITEISGALNQQDAHVQEIDTVFKRKSGKVKKKTPEISSQKNEAYAKLKKHQLDVHLEGSKHLVLENQGKEKIQDRKNKEPDAKEDKIEGSINKKRRKRYSRKKSKVNDEKYQVSPENGEKDQVQSEKAEKVQVPPDYKGEKVRVEKNSPVTVDRKKKPDKVLRPKAITESQPTSKMDSRPDRSSGDAIENPAKSKAGIRQKFRRDRVGRLESGEKFIEVKRAPAEIPVIETKPGTDPIDGDGRKFPVGLTVRIAEKFNELRVRNEVIGGVNGAPVKKRSADLPRRNEKSVWVKKSDLGSGKV